MPPRRLNIKQRLQQQANAATTNNKALAIKLGVLFVIAISILIVTDVIEIKSSSTKNTNNKSNTNNNNGLDHGLDTPLHQQQQHQQQGFGSNVQWKGESQQQQQQYQSPDSTTTTEITSPGSSTIAEIETTTTTSQDALPPTNPAEGIPATTTTTASTSSTTTTTSSTTSTNTNTNTNRITYQRRGQPLTDAERTKMIQKWGSWTLVDEKHDQRPKHDYYKEYPNRDVPRNQFPSNAWQLDSDYLSKFLPQGIELLQRAQEAILAEYGKTSKGTFEERSQMFTIEKIPDEEFNENILRSKMGPDGVRSSKNQGGWFSQSSWDGLVQRMLHAVMTEDSFIFAMGGHSAAAGHGNIFIQSYTLQVQWILEAVFARLGVRHESRNFGGGGLGTVHNGIAAASIYGPDVDVLMWDSGMTEKDGRDTDIFARQQILAATKVPVIWTKRAAVAQNFIVKAGVDAGYVGDGYSGVTIGKTLEEIQAMPWAMQYVRCENDLHQICGANEYIGHCWIDRDDLTPPTKQQAEPGGRAGWHPGNRKHQVQGRVIAFGFLQAMKEALIIWNQAKDNGYELPDETWHLTERYDRVRNKFLSASSLPEEEKIGWCDDFEKVFGLGSICNYPMKARTEFTPRSYPTHTSIRTLMHPDMVAAIGEAPKNIYEPPDVFNPDLHPPKPAIDVLNIVEAGIDFTSVLNPDYVSDYYKRPNFSTSSSSSFPVGKGVDLVTFAGDEYCNGSVDSFCNRGEKQNCLLYGHNDGRNGLLFNELSGWIIFTIPDLKNGIIILKSENWHWEDQPVKTKTWTTVNNERRQRQRQKRQLRHGHLEEEIPDPNYNSLYNNNNNNNNNNIIINNTTTTPETETKTKTNATLSSSQELYNDDYDYEFDYNDYNHYSLLNNNNYDNSNQTEQNYQQQQQQQQQDQRQRHHRYLGKRGAPDYCPEFRFEYSINGGNIVSLTKDEFLSPTYYKKIQRVVELIVLLNDPNHLNFVIKDKMNGDPVEVAIRMTGCGIHKNFQLTHVYWS